MRLLSATHRALRAEVEQGTFRADLMYRLRIIPLYLPALRQRGQDILLLTRYHIHILNQRLAPLIEHEVKGLSTEAELAIKTYPW